MPRFPIMRCNTATAPDAPVRCRRHSATLPSQQPSSRQSWGAADDQAQQDARLCSIASRLMVTKGRTRVSRGWGGGGPASPEAAAGTMALAVAALARPRGSGTTITCEGEAAAQGMRLTCDEFALRVRWWPR